MSIILTVVAVYFVLSLGLGFYVARNEQNVADDYFLAGRKLPWYAISMSMTGSNIGTEHFIGMVGTAYVFGLAPATFEWGNFIPYSILLWIFLPFFFRKKLYTIPEFLERRYNASTRTAFACLTLLYMVVGVLVPALYAGGRILYEMPTGEELTTFNWAFMGCVLIIATVTAAYCIYGGLLSVVWTDVLQVSVLVVGGLLLVLIGVQQAGGPAEVIRQNRETVVRPVAGGSVEVALAEDVESRADKESWYSRTSLLLPADHPVSPWTGVATFWFTLSLWYVGTNQFYIQRCLGARSEWDAKMGVIGCGILKVFLPFIIVFPGLIAFAKFGPGLADDAVYVKMVREFLPLWGQGILLAALIAAIMSTVSSVLNSASTIWSIDVYQRLIDSSANEPALVRMGRWATLVTIILGTLMAPLLLFWHDGIFIFIQNIAALMAPPIVVIFLAAFFWRRAHGRAATFTLWFGIVAGGALWAVTEAPWAWQAASLKDAPVRERLTAILEELPTDDELRKQLDADQTIQGRLKAVRETLAQDPAVQGRLIEDPAVWAHLLLDEEVQARRVAMLKEFTGDTTVKDRVIAILQTFAQDDDIRNSLAENPVLRNQFVQDAEVQAKIAEDEVFLARLMRDETVRKRLVEDERFRAILAEDPIVLERLVEDAAAQARLEYKPKDAEKDGMDRLEVMDRLNADPYVRTYVAERRVAGWLPFLGEGPVEKTVYGIGQIKPLLNRAAVAWGICLVAMVLSTFILRPELHERYDPDAIWNFRWARLPENERPRNAGPRNLMLWWLVMVAASASLFVIFR